MRGFRFVAACLVLSMLAMDAQACQVFGAWFGRRATVSRAPVKKVVRTRTAARTATKYAGGPQAVAEAKAARCAAIGRMTHLGGGYGGANAEGVGFSTRSAADAANNCCFSGQRRLAASAVVRGARGWYAVRLFW